MRIGALAGLAMLAIASPVPATDDKGQFAVRGAALISCAAFTQARASRGDTYRVVASWVDGYVTGANQHARQTYDALSFESTELLMAAIDEHCRRHPQDAVFAVVNSLMEKLWPDRITVKSDKSTIVVGQQEARHYATLVRRVQQALLARGFYSGPVNGTFSAQTVTGVRRFQKSIGFEQTGFPDQATLWRLLREESLRQKK
jgi:hypothetical protein